MRSTPSNSDDIIDSRDVIARIAELESERQGLTDALDAANDARAEVSSMDEDQAAKVERLDGAVIDANDSLAIWDEDNSAELNALKDLASEADGYAPDWAYGVTLIRHSYFVDYCQELLADIGDVPSDLPGYLVIDWEATASNIRIDYTTVDFDGVDYYVR